MSMGWVHLRNGPGKHRLLQPEMHYAVVQMAGTLMHTEVALQIFGLARIEEIYEP